MTAKWAEEKARTILINHEYISISHPGKRRKLMAHHIDALVPEIAQALEDERERAARIAENPPNGIMDMDVDPAVRFTLLLVARTIRE